MTDFTADTVQALDGQLTHPKLIPKLLKRPPFKYIFDIFLGVLQTTGWPQGIFTDDELNRSAIFTPKADNNFKAHWLGKLIKGMQYIEPSLQCEVIDVIKGAQCANTNRLLQVLGQGSRDRVDLSGYLNPNAAPAPREPSPEPVRDEPEPVREHKAPAVTPARETPLPITQPRQPAPQPQHSQLPDTAGMDEFQTTVTLLGALNLKKPPVVPKLVQRPPFAWILDLVAALQQQHGLNVPFSPAELDKANFPRGGNKEGRVAWIKKLVSFADQLAGRSHQVQPINVLSGKETAATNRVLHALAIHCLSGGSGAGSPERQPSPVRTRRPDPSDRSRDPSNRGGAGGGGPVAVPRIQGMPQATAEVGGAPFPGGDGEDEPQLRPERPRTARRAPPKVRTDHQAEQKTRTTTGRISRPSRGGGTGGVSGGATSGAGPAVRGVIAEGVDDEEEEEEEAEDGGDGLSFGPNATSASLGSASSSDGKLTRDIIAKTRELHGASSGGAESSGAGGPGEGLVLDLERDTTEYGAGSGRGGRRRGTPGGGPARKFNPAAGSLSSANMVAQLQDEVQTLCRAVNPLGKYLDYLREDVKQMNSELKKWDIAFHEYRSLYGDEVRKAQRQYQPLLRELSSLDKQLEDQRQKTRALKQRILMNEDRLLKGMRRQVGV